MIAPLYGAYASFTKAREKRGTLEILVILFTTLFTMFYFFRDGHSIWRTIRSCVSNHAATVME